MENDLLLTPSNIGNRETVKIKPFSHSFDEEIENRKVFAVETQNEDRNDFSIKY